MAELQQGSPEWWLDRLDKELEARRPVIKKYEDYYDGVHKLAFATSKFNETFGNLFEGFADNWCDLIVDAAAERLSVEGFRFGGGRDADQEAWKIWQANAMDADSSIANTEAIKCGESYLIVQPGGDEPEITIEHPSQVVVAYHAGSRRRRAAALKKWVDDDGYTKATVYLPDAVHKFRSRSPNGTFGAQAFSGWLPGTASALFNWVPREQEDQVENPLGVVPVVPLLNNPKMIGGGSSDLEKVIPLQDAVNKEITDMLVASEYAAFPQRWAAGIEIPVDPETGKPMDRERFLSSVSRMWTVADTETKFGQFPAANLENYVKAIEMLIQHLAAQTRTPPHYLLGQSGNFPSGESLKATETGLVAKVRRKQVTLGEGYEEAMRLAFKLKGNDERANALNAETIWSDPESRTEGERVDALTKMEKLGVPRKALWERWGATQAEIEEWSREATRQALLTSNFQGSPDEQGAEPEPVEMNGRPA